MGRAEQLRAELAVAELEEELVAVKGDPDADPAQLQATKYALRDARQAFRTLRDGTPPEDAIEATGDGVARPATIRAKAGVKRPGGDG